MIIHTKLEYQLFTSPAVNRATVARQSCGPMASDAPVVSQPNLKFSKFSLKKVGDSTGDRCYEFATDDRLEALCPAPERQSYTLNNEVECARTSHTKFIRQAASSLLQPICLIDDTNACQQRNSETQAHLFKYIPNKAPIGDFNTRNALPSTSESRNRGHPQSGRRFARGGCPARLRPPKGYPQSTHGLYKIDHRKQLHCCAPD